jgi:hydrogenase 3 maturation protease
MEIPRMSSPSWQESLRQALARLEKGSQRPRVAVLGVGHELNGDDAAGLVITRQLLARAEERDHLLVIDAGPAPENQTGALRRFGPDLVLLVDAAQMDELPGTVRWLSWQETTGISASTHTLPPYMLAQYLTAEFGCEVALLGIQPLRNLTEGPLSFPMQSSVDQIVEGLVEALF